MRRWAWKGVEGESRGGLLVLRGLPSCCWGCLRAATAVDGIAIMERILTRYLLYFSRPTGEEKTSCVTDVGCLIA